MEIMVTISYNWITMWLLIGAASEALRTPQWYGSSWSKAEVQACVSLKSSLWVSLLNKYSFAVALTAFCSFQSTFPFHTTAWRDCVHIVQYRVTFLNLLLGLLVGHSPLLVRHSLHLLPLGTPHSSVFLLTAVAAISLVSCAGSSSSISSKCLRAPGVSPCLTCSPLCDFIQSHGLQYLLSTDEFLISLQLQSASWL